ncbi:Med5-domain-containing protein [Aulographum hederae CBS 113979]|uniref:Mediator of RNA polymerase II transcription subunit 5 n=1 Tax=Aulographum hederae CBS 113979 TaxID=1176131 RepID=A0A6G1H547_9PEZI|nr:Med5-domain-containing protein [Aulographum hederae CBS 113979]
MAPARKWKLLFHGCVMKRTATDQFEKYARGLRKSSSIPGRQLAELLMKSQLRIFKSGDIRILVYAEKLLEMDLINSADLLRALFSMSRDHPQPSNPEQGATKREKAQWHSPREMEVWMLEMVSRSIIYNKRPKTQTEARAMLLVLTEWLEGSVSSKSSDAILEAMGTGNPNERDQTTLTHNALGLLAVVMIENPKLAGIIDDFFPKVIRARLGQALTAFINIWASVEPQNASRLEASQKQHWPVEESTTNPSNQDANLDVSALQVDAVVDLPVINTRAGLYIFLNALLVARPLTDDTTILNYLRMRFNVDAESLATDLIVGAFDILANAMYRNDSSQTIFGLRSFLMNKLPVLLNVLSASMFPPLTPEYCIGAALNHVDPHAFPSLSDTFTMSNSNVLADVRQDFLFACTRLHLLPAESVERLLREPPMTSPPSPNSRYTKEGLVAQCNARPERIEEIINELEKLDGNGGAIVGAVVEVIRNMCASKETMSLKTICCALCRKTQFMDVMLQFTSPISFLQPLSNLLDSWRYEDDQGEYRPVYDEFAPILLHVLAYAHRFNLTHQELGIPRDSFVAKLLKGGHVALTVDKLSEAQSKYLSGWIRGLLDADGMSDEPMSQCRPQDFYLLVPTLFNQMVFAGSAGVMTVETIKSGLEYLLEPFLLPSLIGGIMWIADCARAKTYGGNDILTQILAKLLTPLSTPGDGQSMHSTILSIIAPRLTECLEIIQRQEPQRQNLKPLLNILKQHLEFRRSASSAGAELDSWKNPPNNLKQTLRNSIQSLVLWSSAPNINLTPTSYTHRLLQTSLELTGAQRTLHTIVDEVKTQTDAGNGALALDIATSMICAPSTQNSPLAIDWVNSAAPQPPAPCTGMNLRETLKLEFDGAAELVKTDMLAAETVVRLHRRVESQLAFTNQIQMPTMTGLEGEQMVVEDLMQPLDMAAADAAAAAMGQQQAMDYSAGGSMDLSGAGGGIDLGAGGPMDLDVGGAGDMGMSTEDDIFGDLMLGPDMTFD